MSGIAEVLLNLGYVISGSDIGSNAATQRLASLGAKVMLGHATENIIGADAIVTSTAVKLDNPEVIGPAGTKIAGKWPNCNAPINRPGTILSQTPRHRTASNTPCDKAIAVDIAITSRENSDNSIPG